MSKTISKPIVVLRVYFGKEMNYDQDGKVKNKNQTIKLVHDTVEWTNQLKHLHANGYGNIEVENAYTVKVDSSGKEISTAVSKEVLKMIRAEVVNAAGKTAEVAKPASNTGEIQKLIEQNAKQEEQINALLEQNKALLDRLDTSGAPDEDDPDPEKAKLKALKARYKELKGKQGGPTWSVERYEDEIKALEAENENTNTGEGDQNGDQDLE